MTGPEVSFDDEKTQGVGCNEQILMANDSKMMVALEALFSLRSGNVGP